MSVSRFGKLDDTILVSDVYLSPGPSMPHCELTIIWFTLRFLECVQCEDMLVFSDYDGN